LLETDKLSKRYEKTTPRGLSLKNKLRYYGSLLGVTSLAALAAAGCGESSSNSSTSSPNNNRNVPEETGGSQNPGTYEEEAAYPLNTVVTVTLYESDGSGGTYEETMTFGEMQELCEDQREEMVQEAAAAGSEIAVGPIVTLPYTAEGESFDQAPHEYTCGN
jgi:hypothetical protein